MGPVDSDLQADICNANENCRRTVWLAPGTWVTFSGHTVIQGGPGWGKGPQWHHPQSLHHSSHSFTLKQLYLLRPNLWKWDWAVSPFSKQTRRSPASRLHHHLCPASGRGAEGNAECVTLPEGTVSGPRVSQPASLKGHSCLVQHEIRSVGTIRLNYKPVRNASVQLILWTVIVSQPACSETVSIQTPPLPEHPHLFLV